MPLLQVVHARLMFARAMEICLPGGSDRGIQAFDKREQQIVKSLDYVHKGQLFLLRKLWKFLDEI